jgi:hypothetical protein
MIYFSIQTSYCYFSIDVKTRPGINAVALDGSTALGKNEESDNPNARAVGERF